MGELIVIMEKTPFPGHWLPTATCFLQDAEYNVFKGQWKSYHQHAVKLNSSGQRDKTVYAYTRQDAKKMLAYLQQTRPFAQYQLWAHITTSDENGDNDHD